MSGIKLKGISLRNVGDFKELDLTELDSAGFVMVTGLNKDSPSVADNKNGVGKSLIFGTIPNLMYEADPLALAKREKTNMLGKDSQITIEWQAPNGNLMRVDQTAKAYTVYENGEDVKVNRLDVGTEWIKKTWPISQEEFYSFCYIQTQLSHPFQRASESDRLAYMTSLFNFSVYDKIRVEAKKKLDIALDAEKEAKGLADVLDIALRKQKGSKVTKADRQREKELRKAAEELNDLLTEQHGRIVRYEQDVKAAAKWAKITKRIKALGISVSNPKKELKRLKELLQSVRDYARYVRELDEYEKQRKELKAKIGDVPDTDLEKLRDKRAELIKKADKLEDEIDEAKDKQDDFDDYKDLLEGLTIKLKKQPAVKDLREDIEQMMSMCRATVSVYEELKDCMEGKDCPTCGQHVDMKQMKKAATTAADRYKKGKADLEILDLHDKVRELKANPVHPPAIRPDKMKVMWRKLDDQIGDISVAIKNHEKFMGLKAQLDALRKPKKVADPKVKEKAVRDDIERLEDLIELNAALSSLDEPKYGAKELEKKLDALRKKRKRTSAKSKETVAEWDALRSRIEEYGHHKDHIGDIQKKLDKLQPTIETREMWEVVYKAYANNNLKLDAMEDRLKLVEDRLNEYAPSAFAESMTFRLSATKRGISALMTRNVSGRTHDIRIMSGAESNCFRLLWAVAMLPFIPAGRRLDTMILDEPDDKCSPAVREHIIDNFIPLLKTVVPNIFWITTQPIEQYSERRWSVIKDGGVATVEEI